MVVGSGSSAQLDRLVHMGGSVYHQLKVGARRKRTTVAACCRTKSTSRYHPSCFGTPGAAPRGRCPCQGGTSRGGAG